MGKHDLLMGVVASGAMAVGALASAGVASATCASVSGISIGQGCTSTISSTAVAIGPRATASASGGLNTAIALGGGTYAEASHGNLNLAVAQSTKTIDGYGSQANAWGVGNIAVAAGNPGRNARLDSQTGTATATAPMSAALGVFTRSVAFGNGTIAQAGYWDSTTSRPVGNTALAVGHGSTAFSGVLPPKKKFSAAIGPNRTELH